MTLNTYTIIYSLGILNFDILMCIGRWTINCMFQIIGSHIIHYTVWFIIAYTCTGMKHFLLHNIVLPTYACERQVSQIAITLYKRNALKLPTVNKYALWNNWLPSGMMLRYYIRIYTVIYVYITMCECVYGRGTEKTVICHRQFVMLQYYII